MNDFAAIDFETANNCPTSVCSVGVVIVRNGEFVDSFYSLIQPEPNYYYYWNTRVHGLRQEDTENAPVFPYVWEKIEPLIEGLPLVAHTSPFDEGWILNVQFPVPGESEEAEYLEEPEARETLTELLQAANGNYSVVDDYVSRCSDYVDWQSHLDLYDLALEIAASLGLKDYNNGYGQQ